ncbi:mitosis initiation protein fs(1)Ya [Topomyia yanbarensis]|uniref:mitosis initiation protein fs(1)Ya n=1 Tax=Topomyia yanbarensis TaxID=2498891 RepID=UPI00273A9795|nr:mitosis initiation protein fs(1)Ya [Topomyia yanbarensis]
MKIPREVQCQTCSQVFCCAKCRQKHEDNNHKEMKAIRQICYICNDKPFPLRIDTKITPTNLLVGHILKEHLPLRCNRCTKVFHTAADFESIARCFTANENGYEIVDTACYLERSNINIPTIMEGVVVVHPELELDNKENIDENCSTVSSEHSNMQKDQLLPQTVIKVKGRTLTLKPPRISEELNTGTDPNEEIGELSKAKNTPLSMINLRWMRKSRQSFDSLLCTTSNISAVNASEEGFHAPPSSNKKLVRTTSTPMMHGCLPYMKITNESYTSAMGHMSSIRNSNSGSDSDKTDDPTPPPQTSYEIHKVRAISRNRSRVAATPLRQVMSKSIQRAIAQHGYYSKMLAPGTQRKMSFNSTASSGLNSTTGSPSRIALDLRTTPALKRASSESSSFHRTAKLVCLPKSHSEDSTMGDPSSEYCDTHQSLNSQTSSEILEQENRDNQRIDDESLVIRQKANPKLALSYHDTPKITGGMLKKIITFASPEMTRLGEDEAADEDGDVWGTPCALPPRSFSCSVIGDSRFDSILTDDNSDASGSDEVFISSPKTKSCQQQLKLISPAASSGKLWTIVSNVIRLATRGDIQEELAGPAPTSSSGSESERKLSSTIIKKAASFAGFLKNRFPARQQNPSSSGSDESSVHDNLGGLKRRRTASMYTRPYEFFGNTAAVMLSSSPLAKRKRIQGRQPIERMRRNSSRSGSASDI